MPLILLLGRLLLCAGRAGKGDGASADEKALQKELKRQQKAAKKADQQGDTAASRLAHKQALETEIQYETVREQRLAADDTTSKAEQSRQKIAQLQQQLAAYGSI